MTPSPLCVLLLPNGDLEENVSDVAMETSHVVLYKFYILEVY